MSMEITRPSAPVPPSPPPGADSSIPTVYLPSIASPRPSGEAGSLPQSPFLFTPADFQPGSQDSPVDQELLSGKVVHLRPIAGRQYARIPRRKGAVDEEEHDDSRSDLNVEVLSCPSTTDPEDDETHRLLRLKLSEELYHSATSPPSADDKKMFMEDWMRTVDSRPGPWMEKPFDSSPFPYQRLPTVAVPMEAVTEDGHKFEGWLRFFHIPYVSEVDARLDELRNDRMHQGERFVGTWLVPGNPLDDIDRERPDEQVPAAYQKSENLSSEDVQILPRPEFSGPWVPRERDAHDEARRNESRGYRDQYQRWRTPKGSFAAYCMQNDKICGDKEWYQKMSAEEKDDFVARDMIIQIPRVCRLELQPASGEPEVD